MELIKIERSSFEEAIIIPEQGKVRIEVRADEEIDIGVLDDDNYDIFVEADTDEGVEHIKWYEQVSKKSFTVRVPEGEYYWLVLWNAYSRKTVTAAYSIESIE